MSVSSTAKTIRRKTVAEPSHQQLFDQTRALENKLTNALEQIQAWRRDDEERTNRFREDILNKVDAMLGLLGVVGDNAKNLVKRG